MKLLRCGPILGLLILGAQANAEPDFATKQIPTTAVDKVNQKIGKKFWATKATFSICDSLTKDITPCYPAKGDPGGEYGPFLIKKAIFMDNIGQEIAFLIDTPDGELKFLRTYFQDRFISNETHQKQIKARVSAKKECDRKGGVSIGMTQAEVLASCWGKPRAKNITTTANGTHEQWVYGSGYAYFDNGILTSVQTEQ